MRTFFLIALICLLGVFDRALWKANRGFCLSVIDSKASQTFPPESEISLNKDIFSQPFVYLGKGSQSFVFASQDGKTVLKFYRFPSHLRRFPWTHHPIGYLFSSKRKKIEAYNLQKLHLSLQSFSLAQRMLPEETGVLFAHTKASSHLNQKVHLIDHLGYHYHLPLDPLVFVLQKRGESFFAVFKMANLEKQKQMLASLIALIAKRCEKNITDLDNMDNDNYGWLEDRAFHLDIGRFKIRHDLQVKEEILRVTHPLICYLAENHPDLYTAYLNEIALLENPSSCYTR